MNNAERAGMKKVLGRWDSVAIVIAIVIGVGIFRTPYEVAQYLSSPGMMLLAWAAGGFISLTGVLCYAELSASFPRTGGTYVYLKESYGSLTAFLFAWAEILVIRTGSIAAVAYILSEHLISFLGVGSVFVTGTAVFFIAAFGIINAAGLRYGKNVQSVLVLVTVAALVAMIILGFMSGAGDFAHLRSSGEVPGRGGPVMFLLALIPVLWTYGGWHESVFVAGETKNAGKTLPFSLITGILAVTFLYVAANLLYVYLFPVAEIQKTELIGARVFQIICGRYGRKALEAVVVVASVAAINAMIMTGSRITYAVACDNPLLKSMNRIGKSSGAPYIAVMVTSLWSIALVIWGTFGMLLFFTGFLLWSFFALAAAGLFVLRRKYPALVRPYSAWGYPVIPVLFALISAALAVVTFFSHPYPSLVGLAITAGGFPVYYLSRRIRREGL